MKPVIWQGRSLQALRGTLIAALLLLSSPGFAETFGIRHRIDATVAISPDSPLLHMRAEARGSLSFSVRISANSMESRYFGTPSPIFSDIVFSKEALDLIGPRTIWEEDRCHQKRGMPKVTVTLLQGMFRSDHDTVAISSKVRHIGMMVPPDELTPGIKLPAGTDDTGSYYAIRAQSRDSKLNVDLKIYAFDCRF